MYVQLLNRRLVELAAILACSVALPGSVLAGPPASNPGQPFAEILDAIRGVTQNWDKKLDSTNGDTNGCNSDRFTCIFPDATYPDGAAVRDNETGLVWDRSPETDTENWRNALWLCTNREVGGRKGWHSPMIEQLASLVDTNSDLCTGGGLCLPDGHPFQNLAEDRDGAYWSATTLPGAIGAWFVAFGPDWQGRTLPNEKYVSLGAWCVRGGQSYDGQDVENLIPLLP